MTFFSSHCVIWLHKWSIFIHDLSTHVAWLHISSDYTPDLIMIMICPRYDMTTHVVRIHSSSEHTAHLATQVIYLICDLTTQIMCLKKWADYTCDPCTPVIYTRIWINSTCDLSTQVVRLYSWSLSYLSSEGEELQCWCFAFFPSRSFNIYEFRTSLIQAKQENLSAQFTKLTVLILEYMYIQVIKLVSRPLLRLLYGDIGFVYPACLWW